MVFFQKLVYFTSNIRHIGILLVSLTLPETLVVKFAVYAIYIYGQASHKESKRGLYKLLLQSTGGGLSSEWQ